MADPLTITGTLIAVLQVTSAVISVCYDYRQGVTSASREVIQFSDQLNALKDVLEALLKLVESYKLDSLSRLSTVSDLAKENGTLDGCRRELERLQKELTPETGWRKMRRTLTWPLKEKEMRKALDDLERFKSTIQLALSTDQAALTLDIQDALGDLNSTIQKQNLDRERQKIFKWLSAPDVHANHVSNRKKHQAETGLWLLSGKIYRDWLESPKSFLWIYGIPGSGKSILCSTIIEQLVLRSRQTSKTSLAYFYFDFNDSDKKDNNALLRALVAQLFNQSEQLPKSFLDLYNKHERRSGIVNGESLEEVLREFIILSGNTFLVVDALDESVMRDDILQLIQVIKQWDIPQLHLLITSRQLLDIEDSFANLTTHKICLQDSAGNADIAIYVKNRFQNDKTIMKWPKDIKFEIERKLLVEGDGMFQWVVCQLDMLKRCLSVAAVRKALEIGLPKDLNQTYDQILAGIDEQHLPEVMKVLKALIATKAVLFLDEIVEILAVDFEQIPPRFDEDLRIMDPRSILSMCSSLVTFTSSGQYTASGYQGSSLTLKLAHASVADYLLQTRYQGPSGFHFNYSSAQNLLAQACLGYLMSPAFENGYNKYFHTFELDVNPFLEHSATYWPNYIGGNKDNPNFNLDSITMSLLQAFFNTSKLPNGGNFSFWVGILIPSASPEAIRSTQPLYYAASFGLTDVVRTILDTENNLDIDALGGRVQASALHVATYRKHIDIMRMLLERGANSNLPNSLGETPLFWARANASFKQERRDLLIQYGATPFKRSTVRSKVSID